MNCQNIAGVFILLIGTCVTFTSGSGIPMWEFLTRSEKMSHLFNMFTKQVQNYCSTQSMPDCNKVLLVYGLTNLARMEESSLDKMDPYQRGSTDIIWESMMKGSYKTPAPSDFDYSYTTGNDPNPATGNNLGSQEEASTNVQQYLMAVPNSNNNYVIGPMVVRVLPDGSPVPGDAVVPPKDEDAEEFKVMRSKPVPSIEDLMNGKPAQQTHTTPPHPYLSRYEQSEPAQVKSASQPEFVYVRPPPS